MVRVGLVLLLLLLPYAYPDLFPLDDTVPYATSNGVPVVWSQGWDAFAVAESLCVRLNERGVYTLPAHWTLRTDLSGSLAGWAIADCVPAAGTLCNATFGRILPLPTAARPPCYNPVASWGGAGCARAQDGRVLLTPGGYDLSACDVLDNGGDVLVCGRQVAFRQTSLSVWVYWTLCLLAVYAIRSLSYLVLRKLDVVSAAGVVAPKPGPVDEAPWWVPDEDTRTVVACVASTLLVLIPTGDAVYVTSEEQAVFWFACLYVFVYLVVWALVRHDAIAHDDPPLYNLIAGVLQLVAFRLYTGVQTPYNPVILWAVATRALVKLRGGGWNRVVALTVFMDALFLSHLAVYGFGYSACYLVALFATALATSDVFDHGALTEPA